MTFNKKLTLDGLKYYTNKIKNLLTTSILSHNSSDTSHTDIRDLIAGLTTRLNALADSDDATLDQLSEIVAYIKSNRTLIENVTTNKVNVADIIDNLTSTATNKPLSANQGKVLNDLITTLTSTVNANKTKLDGIESGAQKNTITGIKGNSESSYRTGNVNITPANIGAAASSHTHSSYVNQNAFSNVVVGSTTIAADSATDTLTLVAGSNVTITPDATNDKITIAATATALTTSAGSATQPVYFSNGKPVACTYSVRPINNTYTSELTNASTTAFSQKGAYDMYNELNSNLGGLKFSLKHYDNVEIDSTHNVAFVDKSLLPVDITRIKSVFVDGDNCISARRNSESNIIVTKTGDVTSLNFDLLFLYA